METESLWDETIDDIALSQATNEIECEYLFGELSLSQLSVFYMGSGGIAYSRQHDGHARGQLPVRIFRIYGVEKSENGD